MKKGDIYILRDDSTSDEQDITVLGPFKSTDKARKRIKKDVAESMSDDNDVTIGRMEDYASKYCIVDIIDCIHAVPVVSVRVALESE